MNHLIAHNGRVYSPYGPVDVPVEAVSARNRAADQYDLLLAETLPSRLVAYWKGSETLHGRGKATTWLGSGLGPGVVTGRWKVPNGWMSGFMLSVRVSIGEAEYIGRCSGSGMLLRLRKSNKRVDF